MVLPRCDDPKCTVRRPSVPKGMPLSDIFVVTHKNRLKENMGKAKEDRRGQARKAKSVPLRHSWPIGLILESSAALVKKDPSCLKLQTGISLVAR